MVTIQQFVEKSEFDELQTVHQKPMVMIKGVKSLIFEVGTLTLVICHSKKWKDRTIILNSEDS